MMPNLMKFIPCRRKPIMGLRRASVLKEGVKTGYEKADKSGIGGKFR
jgi:hypothetical protein